MGNTVDVEPPRFLAFVGTIIMLIEGFQYLLRGFDALDTITGIVCIAGGVILLLTIGVGFTTNLPIPYKWWILLAIGGAAITMAILTQAIRYGILLGAQWYLGGLLVGIAGLLELGLHDKMKMDHASKFVLFIGACMAIIISLLFGTWLGWILGIALGVLVLLVVFNVLPFEWWLVLIFGAVIFTFLHANTGAVILVGWIMMMINE